MTSGLTTTGDGLAPGFENGGGKMSDDELVDRLRRAASVWFKNTDLILLEELIRRYASARQAHGQSSDKTPADRR